MFRNGIQRLANRAGYAVGRWPPEGTLAREVQRLLQARSIRTVVDIGAHVGSYGRMLRAVGFDGRIISFEPSPRPFGELCRRLDPGWQAFPLALSDQQRDATLHLYEAHEELASFHDPNPATNWTFGRRTQVTVPTRRLDDLIEELQITPAATFIKIDTQGHDAAVMRGGQRAIARAQALQVELPATRIYDGAASLEELIAEVHGAGFSLLGLYPVHAHPRPLVPVEFDGLFVRTN